MLINSNQCRFHQELNVHKEIPVFIKYFLCLSRGTGDHNKQPVFYQSYTSVQKELLVYVRSYWGLPKANVHKELQVFVSSPRATAVNQELLVLINIDAPLNTVTHSALFLLCGLQIPKSKYFILIDYFNA